jgi:outer membrane immunogenic protein
MEIRMKRVSGLVGAMLLFAGPVFAADLATKPLYAPVFSWTGFYVGVNGGGGWSNSTGDLFCETPARVVGGFGCSSSAPGTLKPGGGIFGGQAGYNFQTGPFVWGIETDIQWSGIKASATSAVPCCVGIAGDTGVGTTSQSLDWFGTVRGRMGYTLWDRGLLYGTGGLIYGQEKVSGSLTFPVAGYGPASDASTHAGWTAGGGFEYAFTNNVTGKIEGLYYDMGSQTLSATAPANNGFTESATFNYKGVLVRAGLNWKF